MNIIVNHFSVGESGQQLNEMESEYFNPKRLVILTVVLQVVTILLVLL